MLKGAVEGFWVESYKNGRLPISDKGYRDLLISMKEQLLETSYSLIGHANIRPS